MTKKFLVTRRFVSFYFVTERQQENKNPVSPKTQQTGRNKHNETFTLDLLYKRNLHRKVSFSTENGGFENLKY